MLCRNTAVLKFCRPEIDAASLVNCTPWSALKISGTLIPNALSRASRQKRVSRVFDRHQDRT